MRLRSRIQRLRALTVLLPAIGIASLIGGASLALAASPSITLTPICGPAAQPGAVALTYDITVSGSNFPYSPLGGNVMYFSFAGRFLPTEVILNPDGTFTTAIQPLQEPPGTYTTTVDGQSGGTASAPFTVPCNPRVSITPTCGPPVSPADRTTTYSVAATGSEFSPDSEVVLFFAGSVVGKASTDRTGSFTTTFSLPGKPTGNYAVVVLDLRPQTRTSTTFQVPCPYHPMLLLVPKVGPPGFVPMATGTGFPPNTMVVLRWNPGITALPATVSSDASGTFQVMVLVLHHDLLGPRQLQAAPLIAGAFPPVSAPFLVVPGSAQPPDFTQRR